MKSQVSLFAWGEYIYMCVCVCARAHQFQETDPVNLAINCREEQLAIYLVEKSFSVTKLYQVSFCENIVLKTDILCVIFMKHVQNAALGVMNRPLIPRSGQCKVVLIFTTGKVVFISGFNVFGGENYTRHIYKSMLVKYIDLLLHFY